MSVKAPISPNTFPDVRMRRLRHHPMVRQLVQETELTTKDLIAPLFIKSGIKNSQPIKTMPGQFQLSIDSLPKEIETLSQLNIGAVLLFGIPENKDSMAKSGYEDNNIIQQAIIKIKQTDPDLLIITDNCLCEYTDHGHCGIMREINNKMDLDNDASLDLIARQALSFAKAGADVIAPSGMLDGAVSAIRQILDRHQFNHMPILSYAAKYASSCYGPFRDAAESTPAFGDRRSYQMDPANSTQALREVALDITEGADIIMVKPALFYLDIISKIKTNHPELPLAAYQVSGEFAMIKAAAAKGYLDEKAVILESLLAIKRAGADMIISYFAKDAAKYLKN